MTTDLKSSSEEDAVIYLDNSATTQPDEDVVQAMLPWLSKNFGNASAIYSTGRTARIAIEDAREEIASLVNAHPAEIFFTSGGTESNNTVLKSCCVESSLSRNVWYSSTEHHAVIHPAEELAQQGFGVNTIPVDPDGIAQLDHVNPSDGDLISIHHANNETGTIQPIEKLKARFPSAFIHTDAVQSFGKIPFDTQALHIDFASFSAHKIHGPKGVGAVFVRKGIDFKSHVHGGGQERNRRAGTEAVAQIVGFQVAARNAIAEMSIRSQHCEILCQALRESLGQSIPNIRFNTSTANSLPNIINISFLDDERLDGEAILQLMDMKSIAVSNGSACVSGSLQPSHVLSAMGRNSNESMTAVRFSVSKNNTLEEVRVAVEALAGIVFQLRL